MTDETGKSTWRERRAELLKLTRQKTLEDALEVAFNPEGREYPRAAYYAGLLEGAADALGLTILELDDEFEAA